MSPKKKQSPSPRARMPAAVRVIVFRIRLVGFSPEIWREVCVPAEFTLARLHRVIQCVFSWLDYHLYLFEVRGTRFVGPRLEMEGEDPARATLADFEFARGDRLTYRYDFGDDWEHELVVTEISTVPAEDAFARLPRVLAGERAAPPEDCGGPPGYPALLEALADARHPNHANATEWVPRGFDPERFDLPSVDHALALACAWGAV